MVELRAKDWDAELLPSTALSARLDGGKQGAALPELRAVIHAQDAEDAAVVETMLVDMPRAQVLVIWMTREGTVQLSGTAGLA